MIETVVTDQSSHAAKASKRVMMSVRMIEGRTVKRANGSLDDGMDTGTY